MAKDNVIEMRVDKDTGEVVHEGKTLEQIADEVANEAEAMSGFLRGSNPQLTLDVGGKRPTGSILKIKGSDFPIVGQFPKNKKLKVLLDLEVGTISFNTVRDKDRYVVGHDRVHVAEVNGIQANVLDQVMALCDEHEASELLRGHLIDLLG